MPDTIQQKQRVRKSIAQRFGHFALHERQLADERILDRLMNYSFLKDTRTICTYVSMTDEVDTMTLIKKLTGKKIILVPKIASAGRMDLYEIKSADDLTLGSFNIPEPKTTCRSASSSAVECFIVPGVAFDRKGNRLGRGLGYYDRLLDNVRVPKIGLAYDFQVLAQVPHSSYDVSMTAIVTEKETITA